MEKRLKRGRHKNDGLEASLCGDAHSMSDRASLSFVCKGVRHLWNPNVYLLRMFLELRRRQQNANVLLSAFAPRFFEITWMLYYTEMTYHPEIIVDLYLIPHS